MFEFTSIDSSRTSSRPMTAQNSSLSSIDKSLACIGEPDSYLLAESFPLTASTASFESEDVAPFPSDRTPPRMAGILGLGTHLPMFPQGLPRVGGFGVVDKFVDAIITAPTAPRLKVMLKESLCVKKWAESIAVSEAPGHTPWGDLEDLPPVTWMANGSLFPDEKFRELLSEYRHARNLLTLKPIRRVPSSSDTRPQTSSPCRSLGRRASFHPGSTSFRKALVFESEITLNTDGKRKRWSLQVPPTTMNPEMVDMMIELQDLNSFFKGGLENLDHSVSVLDKEKKRLVQPTLVVSNSNFALPISLESSPSLVSEVPLAIRRGMQVPPPLTFNYRMGQDLYPGIPSAFLSPSASSPNTMVPSHTDDLSMDLEAMVANLRSRCAPFQEFSTPVSGSFDSGLEDIPHPDFSTSSSDADDEEDEWAFANDLMESYVKEVFLDEPTKSTVGLHSTLVDHDVFSTLTHAAPVVHLEKSADTESHTTPNFTAKGDTFVSGPTKTSIGKPQLVEPARKKLANPTTIRPPSTPLPPRPAIVNTSTPKLVRGILKSCKSVRFASLPSTGDDNTVVEAMPRKPSGASAASPPSVTSKPAHSSISSPPRATPLGTRLMPAMNGTTRSSMTPTSPSPPRLRQRRVSHIVLKQNAITPASTTRATPTPASAKTEKREAVINPLPPWNSRPVVLSSKKTTSLAVPSSSQSIKPSVPLEGSLWSTLARRTDLGQAHLQPLLQGGLF